MLPTTRVKFLQSFANPSVLLVPHRGTRNAILTLKTIIESSIGMQRDTDMSFIDYVKANDRETL